MSTVVSRAEQEMHFVEVGEALVRCEASLDHGLPARSATGRPMRNFPHRPAPMTRLARRTTEWRCTTRSMTPQGTVPESPPWDASAKGRNRARRDL